MGGVDMSRYWDDQKDDPKVGPIARDVGIVVVLTVALFMGGCPQYKVYTQRTDGEAELAQANYSKQVAVQTALAKKESAQYEADAEVIRAKGVAAANKIIAGSITEPYLRYLFVNGLEHTQNQVIYVPTETQLPILEATRKSAAPAVAMP